MVWTVRSHFVSLKRIASKSALKIQLGSYRWLKKSFLTSPLWESVCRAQMSYYQINFGARKGETTLTEKNSEEPTTKLHYEANRKYPLESAAPINFKSLRFAVSSSETLVFTFFDISKCQKCATARCRQLFSRLVPTTKKKREIFA